MYIVCKCYKMRWKEFTSIENENEIKRALIYGKVRFFPLSIFGKLRKKKKQQQKNPVSRYTYTHRTISTATSLVPSIRSRVLSCRGGSGMVSRITGSQWQILGLLFNPWVVQTVLLPNYIWGVQVNAFDFLRILWGFCRFDRFPNLPCHLWDRNSLPPSFLPCQREKTNAARGSIDHTVRPPRLRSCGSVKFRNSNCHPQGGSAWRNNDKNSKTCVSVAFCILDKIKGQQQHLKIV